MNIRSSVFIEKNIKLIESFSPFQEKMYFKSGISISGKIFFENAHQIFYCTSIFSSTKLERIPEFGLFYFIGYIQIFPSIIIGLIQRILVIIPQQSGAYVPQPSIVGFAMRVEQWECLGLFQIQVAQMDSETESVPFKIS